MSQQVRVWQMMGKLSGAAGTAALALLVLAIQQQADDKPWSDWLWLSAGLAIVALALLVGSHLSKGKRLKKEKQELEAAQAKAAQTPPKAAEPVPPVAPKSNLQSTAFKFTHVMGLKVKNSSVKRMDVGTDLWDVRDAEFDGFNVEGREDKP